ARWLRVVSLGGAPKLVALDLACWRPKFLQASSAISGVCYRFSCTTKCRIYKTLEICYKEKRVIRESDA
ncbi:MAG: hypothetical protein L7F78_08185, partial [Syntrophales bacterium LBB04]|nr:hypothetical protein [Syntrophales bacterium LBB04]